MSFLAVCFGNSGKILGIRNNWEHIAQDSFSHSACKGGISYGQYKMLLQLKGVPCRLQANKLMILYDALGPSFLGKCFFPSVLLRGQMMANTQEKTLPSGTDFHQ